MIFIPLKWWNTPPRYLRNAALPITPIAYPDYHGYPGSQGDGSLSSLLWKNNDVQMGHNDYLFSGTRDPGSRDPGSGIPDLGPRIRDPGSGIPDLGSREIIDCYDPSRIPHPGSVIPDPEWLIFMTHLKGLFLQCKLINDRLPWDPGNP